MIKSMDSRAQGSLEYLLLIGGALIVSAVVIALALGILDTGKHVVHSAENQVTHIATHGV